MSDDPNNCNVVTKKQKKVSILYILYDKTIYHTILLGLILNGIL